MNDTMHFEIVRQVARDRTDRLIREADAHRLARAARGARRVRWAFPAVAGLADRLRIARPAAPTGA